MGGCPAFCQGIGGIVSFGPFAVFGEGRSVAVETGALIEYSQPECAYRGGTQFVYVFGQGLHADLAGSVIVWPQHHVATGQWGEIGFAPGVRAVRPAGGHILRHQGSGSIGSFFTFTNYDRISGALRDLIQVKERARLSQTLPAPLFHGAIRTLTPR
ncbi:hypothetical protein D3C84_478870 [compost metagenome]